MSPLLQEIFCYVGQLNVYEKSTAILEKLLGITTNNMQVNKVTDFYGKQCSKNESLLVPVLKGIKKSEYVYVEADGSMLFTRDAGWKEVKVGRIFKSSDSISSEGKPSYIRHSQYYAHLGDSNTFTAHMDKLIDRYQLSQKQLIFISDGALWIKNWIEDAFPGAISILDFYHAKEHLYQFIEVTFKDKSASKDWGEYQCDLLLESRLEEVIKNIEIVINPENKKIGESLIGYYKSNKERMDYKKYKQIGTCIIGSGAIESAHRTLIQNRMKLSGQRWSLSGAQNMLNMKTVYMNERWADIIELTMAKAA